MDNSSKEINFYHQNLDELKKISQQYQKMFDSLNLPLHIQMMINPILNYRSISERLQKEIPIYQKMFDSLNLPLLTMYTAKDFTSTFNKLVEFEKHYKSQTALFSEITKSLVIPSEVIKLNLSSIYKTISQAKLENLNLLKTLCIKPSLELQSFSIKTLEECKSYEPNSSKYIAGTASIECAIIETITNTELTINAINKITTFEITKEIIPVTLPTFNLFEISKNEITTFISNNPDIVKDKMFFNKIPSFNYLQLAQILCRLVIDCNEKCGAIGKEKMFKLTNKLCEAINSLPSILSINKSTFGEFINFLYILLYEGAGADNLRFREYISDKEASPIWNIKQLRNFYLFCHDVEHGDEKEAYKKQKRVGEIFNSLIGKPLPESDIDFRNIQMRIMYDAIKMIRTIINKIK